MHLGFFCTGSVEYMLMCDVYAFGLGVCSALNSNKTDGDLLSNEGDIKTIMLLIGAFVGQFA